MELIVLGVLAAAVVALTFVIGAGRLRVDLLAPPAPTGPALEFSDPVVSTDVDGLKLGTAAWGYSLRQVDAALATRRDRLAQQERALAERSRDVHSDS